MSKKVQLEGNFGGSREDIYPATMAEIVYAKDGKNLEEKINETNAQLSQKANANEVVKKGYGTLSDFDEETRRAIQGMSSTEINAVLGLDNVLVENASFIEKANILYNKEVRDRTYVSDNGAVVESNNYKSYLNVGLNTGVDYYFIIEPLDSSVRNVVFYNKNGNATRSVSYLNQNTPISLTSDEVKISFSVSNSVNKCLLSADSNFKDKLQGVCVDLSDVVGIDTLFDQSLNTTDHVKFKSVEVERLKGEVILTDNIKNRQVTAEKTDFIICEENNIAKDVTLFDGYLDLADGSFVSSLNFKTTDFIELQKNVKYRCEYSGIANGQTEPQSYPRAILMYNEDKSFSRILNLPADMTNGCFELKDNEKYTRVNMYKTENTLKIYPLGQNSGMKKLDESIKVLASNLVGIDELKEELKEAIKIDVVSNPNIFNFYGKKRKCIISFILDGEYDMNETMEAIFDSYGYKIGFAPQYNTNFTNNSVEKYLEWQSKGHEILAHGNYVFNNDATYTEEEAEMYIKSSYETLTNLGFDLKGYIGSSGFVADRYKKYISDYYHYSATMYNHANNERAFLQFKTDNPHSIWRYSMEASTIDEMKLSVDRAIESNGLLLFYGHAKTTNNNNNFTTVNLNELLQYIASKKCNVLSPFKAISDFYSLRYDDFF